MYDSESFEIIAKLCVCVLYLFLGDISSDNQMSSDHRRRNKNISIDKNPEN